MIPMSKHSYNTKGEITASSIYKKPTNREQSLPMSTTSSPRLNNKKDDDAEIISKNETITLRIKCNSPGVDHLEDREVVTHSSASVHSLKESVRNAIGQSARGRYLRIIASGRLLAPDIAPLSNFKISDGDCVHAVLAAAGIRYVSCFVFYAFFSDYIVLLLCC